jgi:hypothetical protein
LARKRALALLQNAAAKSGLNEICLVEILDRVGVPRYIYQNNAPIIPHFGIFRIDSQSLVEACERLGRAI